MQAEFLHSEIVNKNERLKWARARKYRTQDLAAEALGVPKGTLAGHEAGSRNFGDDEAELYAKRFGVPLAWLALGEGPEPRDLPKLISTFDPDELDRGEADYAPRMVEGTEGRDVGEMPVGAILQVDVSLGMGGGGITHVTDLMSPNGQSYAAEGIKGFWQLPPDVVASLFRVPVNRIRCFEAHGDSMTPTVANGDYVFVDIGHRVPSPPGVYALADALGGVILKRVEISTKRGVDPVRVRLISDNPHHTPEDSTLDEITITGRYLGRLTTS